MKNLAPPPNGRLLVKRDGSSITKVIPKPVIIVDTRPRPAPKGTPSALHATWNRRRLKESLSGNILKSTRDNHIVLSRVQFVIYESEQSYR